MKCFLVPLKILLTTFIKNANYNEISISAKFQPYFKKADASNTKSSTPKFKTNQNTKIKSRKVFLLFQMKEQDY